MAELINNEGSVVNERTTACIEQVKSIVRQHLDCLIDSGAKGSEIKAITKFFCQAIEMASIDAIVELLDQVVERLEEGKDE